MSDSVFVPEKAGIVTTKDLDRRMKGANKLVVPEGTDESTFITNSDNIVKLTFIVDDLTAAVKELSERVGSAERNCQEDDERITAIESAMAATKKEKQGGK